MKDQKVSSKVGSFVLTGALSIMMEPLLSEFLNQATTKQHRKGSGTAHHERVGRAAAGHGAVVPKVEAVQRVCDVVDPQGNLLPEC